jgi:hypothetical protein
MLQVVSSFHGNNIQFLRKDKQTKKEMKRVSVITKMVVNREVRVQSCLGKLVTIIRVYNCCVTVKLSACTCTNPFILWVALSGFETRLDN